MSSVYSTSGELIGILSGEMPGLNALQYKNAVNRALVETGFAFPPGNDFKEHWTYERSKRHCIDILTMSSAGEYRVKQYHRGQKFDHYYKLIVKMDEDFETAIAENPAEFAGVEHCSAGRHLGV